MAIQRARTGIVHPYWIELKLSELKLSELAVSELLSDRA